MEIPVNQPRASMRWLERSDRIVRSIEKFCVGIAGIAMFLIMMVVVIDVVLRYFFNAPLSWAFELISLYLMVGLFFFALSDTLANHAHVCVDILHLYMPARLRHAAEFIGYAAAIPVFVGIFYMSVTATWEAYQGAEVLAGHIAWPTWPARLCVPFGVGVLLLRMALRFIGHALSLLLKRSVVALPPISGTEEAI
jgi:TRAP-type C4-dicarboxylate transport system permease small subunit